MSSMNSVPNSIAKDLFPRALGMVLVVIAVFIATDFIDKADQDEWLAKIEVANARSIESLDTTIDKRMEIVTKLAEDGRLQPLFADDFVIGDKPPKKARRALYEFKYVHEIDHAYVFHSSYGEVIINTAGSPDLPARSIQPFMNAAKNDLPHLTNIVLIGGQSYVLVAQAIRSETGKIIGYAIYTDPTKNFFKDVGKSLSTFKHITFNSYMMDDDTAISVENFTYLSSSMRIINEGDSELPIFNDSFPAQEFTLLSGEEILAVGGYSQPMPKWKVVTTVDMLTVLAASNDTRTLLIAALILSIITLILLPINGPYTDVLKSIYVKAGLMKEEKKPPTIDANSIDRMRYGSPPPLGDPSQEQQYQNRKVNNENKPKKKEDFRPSDAVIAYNIRTGMKNKRIKLLYQPILDSNTNEPYMYEVFLRIIDDEGKTMPPSLWLPVAAKENLFSLIDETVVGMAIEKFFMRSSPLATALAFNISGNTFSSLEFLEQIMAGSASQYPIAQNTIFELRSREIIEDKRAMTFIKECREMGFRFSIDYFGGGAQTLKAAKTLKFDFIKIDILQFDLDTKEGQKDFIKLVKTAQAIDLPIVAEKIEDERTLRFCKKLGVNFVQGYHIAEPSPDLYKE